MGAQFVPRTFVEFINLLISGRNRPRKLIFFSINRIGEIFKRVEMYIRATEQTVVVLSSPGLDQTFLFDKIFRITFLFPSIFIYLQSDRFFRSICIFSSVLARWNIGTLERKTMHLCLAKWRTSVCLPQPLRSIHRGALALYPANIARWDPYGSEQLNRNIDYAFRIIFHPPSPL